MNPSSERRAVSGSGKHRSTPARPCEAITAVLPGKLDNIGCETLLVVTAARDLALRRAMLPERRTGATLGDMQLRSDLLNAGTATRGAGPIIFHAVWI